jgi:predicted O-methyltransferase YrrM
MEHKQLWEQVDNYFTNNLHHEDAIMENVLNENSREGLPAIDVSASQGKFLYLLALMKGSKTILEIGTLGGYSSIWLARALPADGKLVTLEYSEKHAEVARKNIAAAGLEDKIEVIVGPALDSLPLLKEKGYSHFDFIFIDADKPNNPHYLKWAITYSKSGTVIIGDNVVRNGKVIDENSSDDKIKGVQEFIELLGAETRIDAAAIQTVGTKGYDGFVLAVVK